MEKGEDNCFHLSQSVSISLPAINRGKKNNSRGYSRKSYFPLNSVLQERKIKCLSTLLRKKKTW